MTLTAAQHRALAAEMARGWHRWGQTTALRRRAVALALADEASGVRRRGRTPPASSPWYGRGSQPFAERIRALRRARAVEDAGRR